MINLKSYLENNLNAISESLLMERTTPALLLTFDDAMKFFADRPYFTQVFGEDYQFIKDMYQLMDEKNLPAPIVAPYSSRYNMALRRWTRRFTEDDKYTDEDGYTLLNRIKYTAENKVNVGGKRMFKLFPTDIFHNTNLLEPGKMPAKITGADYEILISLAHNKYYSKDKEKDFAAYLGEVLSTTATDEQIRKYSQFYEDEQDILLKIIQPLEGFAKDLIKLKNYPNSLIKNNDKWMRWYEVGGKFLGMPNGTPKTDILYANENARFSFKNISFKNLRGSRLMSGAEGEARATLYASLEYNNLKGKEEIRKELEDIFPLDHAVLVHNINRDDKGEVDIENQRNLSNKLSILFEKYPEYKRAVLKEATSGEIKFDVTGLKDAIPTHVFSYDSVSGKSILQTVDDFVNAHLEDSKIYISFKTAAGPTTSQVLQIGV